MLIADWTSTTTERLAGCAQTEGSKGDGGSATRDSRILCRTTPACRWRSCHWAAPLALLTAVLESRSSLAYSTGSYSGSTNRNGTVKFRVEGSSVKGFAISVLYKCTDGTRFRATERFSSMKIRSSGFGERFTGLHGAGSWRLSVQLGEPVATGSLTGRVRYNCRNRPDRHGSVFCRTGTATFTVSSPRPTGQPSQPQQPGPPAPRPPAAPSGPRSLACSSLPGLGNFTNPKIIGTITQTTVAIGCCPLTSGYGEQTARDFEFTLPFTAPSRSYAGSHFVLTPEAISEVHPRLDAPNGTILLTAGDAFPVGENPRTGWLLDISGLRAGTYVLQLEKLDSPLRSLTTPYFDAVIIIG